MVKKRLFFSIVVLAVVLLMPVSAQAKETLAVLDFTTEAVSKTEMSAIVEFLSAELFNTDKYIVIDVSQRETILNEMEFSMSGCSDDSCALEIGKLLSAELIVTGNLSKVGSRYLMSVKMLETETSKTVGTANGKFTDLDQLIDGLEGIALTLSGMEKDAGTAVAEQSAPETKPEIQQEETPSTDSGAAVAQEDDGPEMFPPEKADTQKTEKSKGSTVPAIICTATGVAGIGVGGYFLYQLFSNSLPAYNDAKNSYDNAYGDVDYKSLYEASVNAYDDAFSDFIIGAGAAGLGVVLTTVGIILFPPKEDKDSELSFMPVISDKPGMVVRVSY